MSERKKRMPIQGKIIIKGKITCRSGLFIGGVEESLGIGDIDSNIIRDPVTMEPYIPGSSLKGKMRSLFERKENKEFNQKGNKDVYRHECGEEECSVCRVFGSADGAISRIMVRDAYLTEESRKQLDELDTEMPFVEIKKENTLDRVTAQASPRTLERVPAGAEFAFEISYTADCAEHKKEDVFNIFSLLALLEDDALGGNTSRGYGRIEFSELQCVAKPIDFYRGKTGEDELAVVDFNELLEINKKQKKLEQLLATV